MKIPSSIFLKFAIFFPFIVQLPLRAFGHLLTVFGQVFW